ncbi:LEA type 2 family protein [Stenotrophomonas sp. MMGLT7]|uniref:NDR1/HIN1-like protein n=1 Tax=Stenotrophomonas sp. MMGLT7 TaxID=2901227 RepID=UPI001E54D3C4|nr:LEA type 2 family protein [Stenotrophomonas sp. MMGLT7]MCD7097197.1 LEA type 2 family protein [Stenotrophomonas sp. MMGLT7]
MRHRIPILRSLLVLSILLLGACGHGMVKRVSEPAASIQQLTVRADGSWQLELRLQNYSSIPMRFDGIELKATLADQQAGTLKLAPALTIGPESADVVALPVQPSSAARIVLADALAGRRSIGYRLEGTISATPQDKKQRTFEVDTRNTLTPAPGLDGVLR